MEKRGFLIAWFSLLAVFVCMSSPVRAVPLSLQENIKAVVENQPRPGKAFNFIVMGDNRDGVEVYKRLLDRTRAFEPLFILHTGDIVTNGQPSEYEDYIKQIAPFPIPILHLPGNHETRLGSETFRKYVGEPNWYFDLNGFRIIGLDNGAGKFNTDALAFAQKNLTSRKVCLVAFHVPPSIGRWAVHAMREDSGEVIGLIKKAKVPMVFMGHIHLYDEMDIGGTKYIISAGGGANLHGKYNFGKAEYGFVVVRVTPKGITHQWVPLD
jgi:3',5'-cyclic AMP phosphodiesterase CpdA